VCSTVLILFGKNLPKVRPLVRTQLNKMNNKTQRRIHKCFFSHYFCFVFFRKNNIRGNAATNNTPNEGEKKIIEENRGSRKVTLVSEMVVAI
jgi:hypothetical protein